jgi:hypothetical protein
MPEDDEWTELLYLCTHSSLHFSHWNEWITLKKSKSGLKLLKMRLIQLDSKLLTKAQHCCLLWRIWIAHHHLKFMFEILQAIIRFGEVWKFIGLYSQPQYPDLERNGSILNNF